MAQGHPVTGKVTNATDGTPLPGVSVIIQGTSTGTSTDFDGLFTLNVPSNDVSLEFSSMGFKNQVVPVGANSTIDVALEEDANALDEVIVVGYGTKKKRDITSAVSQITSEQIAVSVQASPEFALQGTTSGILVQSASGDPNARPTIRIRGVGTLGFNDPLYVVDGVPISEFGAGATAFASGAGANDIRGSQNILNLINPNDIASISVLKDAAATAVYGMRASNGVILIETKRGKGTGKVSFNFSARTGVRNVNKTNSVLNTSQYTNLLTEQYNNAGLAIPSFIDPNDAAYLGGGETYDWQDAITNKNAMTSDYNFSAQSGTEKANFYFSGGVSNQESTLKYNKLKRYTATLTSDFKVTDWLKLGETINIASSKNDDAKAVAGGMNLTDAFLTPAWQPIYDESDEYGYARVRADNGDPLWGDSVGGTRPNVLAVGDINSNEYKTFRNLGNVYAELTPIEGLTIKGTVGVDWNNQKRQWINSRRAWPYHTNSQDRTTFDIRDLTNWSVLTEALASYTKDIGDHNINVLVNVSKQEIGTEWIQSDAVNPIFDDLDRAGMSFAESTAGESFKEKKILSGTLLKFSYNFKSKYYLDGSYRRDGSSVFAPENRFGDFYGASAAWRISDESFMENVSWLNDLKLRASWGQTGNQETQAFSYFASIRLSPAYGLGNGDPSGNLSGAYQPGIPNVELGWETSTTTNIGFDGSALDHRLGFGFDYYDRLTEDILQPFPLPVTRGVGQNPVVNLAEVSNKGIELNLNWNDNIGDFNYDIGMNFTTVTNKVEKLADEVADGAILSNGYYGIAVGESINFIYGYEMDGIFQTQAEVDAWKVDHTDEAGSQVDISPGDVRFSDLFGNPAPGEFKSDTPDGLINANDRTVLGKTIPGYFYGFNLGADYKGFDFSMQWQGVGDVQKVNQVKGWGESMAGHANQLASTANRWTPTNASNSIPRALINDVVNNNRFSSRIVEDADYLRLQNLQVGYTLSSDTAAKVGLKNIRFYVSGNNLLTITDYSGLDPDANLTSNTDINPPATAWLLGVNLTF